MSKELIFFNLLITWTPLKNYLLRNWDLDVWDEIIPIDKFLLRYLAVYVCIFLCTREYKRQPVNIFPKVSCFAHHFLVLKCGSKNCTTILRTVLRSQDGTAVSRNARCSQNYKAIAQQFPASEVPSHGSHHHSDRDVGPPMAALIILTEMWALPWQPSSFWERRGSSHGSPHHSERDVGPPMAALIILRETWVLPWQP